MLINFSVTNYKSFKERADFSMHLSRSKKSPAYKENMMVAKPKDSNEIPLLTSAAIYGANASGKSNLIKALIAMDRAILSSNFGYAIEPFLLSKKTSDKPTEFSIAVIAKDNIIYEYGFSATKELIHDEYLYAYPNGKRSLYYERILQENGQEYKYKYGSSLTGEKKVWEKSTRPDRLFLSTAVQLNSKDLMHFSNWFRDKLFIIDRHGIPSEHVVGFHHAENDYGEILKFLRVADINIEDIKVEEEERAFYDNDGSERGKYKDYTISTFHKTEEGDIFPFNIRQESQGTQNMLNISYPILEALNKGKVLVVDELDNSLHPLLVKHIVSLFNNKKKNKTNAQLIFSTHDTTHFNDDTLQRDQVWICNKDNKEASEIYSLAEYKVRPDITNLQGAYLSGRYGGIPVFPDED